MVAIIWLLATRNCSSPSFLQIGGIFSLTISVSIPLHRDLPSRGEEFKAAAVYREVDRIERKQPERLNYPEIGTVGSV